MLAFSRFVINADFTEIQIKVCQDTIHRMEQAKEQKNEAAFNLEKVRLFEVLEIIRTADPSTYAEYSKISEITFHTVD